ncbi:MAG: ImuA family protein [Mesorhizobium sp.]
MATIATARETLFALRRQIARIEGTPAERLEIPPTDPASDAGVVLREGGVTLRHGVHAGGVLATGADAFDAALGGGLPRAALTEIHGAEIRDAGTVSGFALGLAALALSSGLPLLWIAAADTHREAGAPYAPGLLSRFGIPPERLLFCETVRLDDALWVADEAARLSSIGMVLFELRGQARRLDLTATRRLHFRARDAGRPVLLLRHSAPVEATAAPVRLLVSPAAAGLRSTVSGPLAGSIGPPAFGVVLDKSRTGASGRFELEWNAHDRTFRHRRPEDPVTLVPLSSNRGHLAAPAWPRLALDAGDAAPAAGHQPAREERAADRRPRRTG